MPGSIADLQAAVRRAKTANLPISIAGGRHAAGGQQLGAGTMLVDMAGMKDVIRFDRTSGLVEAEAGITWTDLLQFLRDHQLDAGPQWGFRQKQIGTDRLTLGGTLAANAHGHGLALKPIVDDVESFILVDPAAGLRRCSRTENKDLFQLAIGGYGLFGIIAHVELRLVPRVRMERLVEPIAVEDLAALVERRVKEGHVYGEAQLAIDPASDDFLKRGIFTSWHPVPDKTPLTTPPAALSEENQRELAFLTHTEPAVAFERFSSFYLGTTKQVEWSDEHQMGSALETDHQALDLRTSAKEPGSDLLAELNVPRDALVPFLADVRTFLQGEKSGPLDATIRFIEKDDETFLPWARGRFATVTFNLHVTRSPQGTEQASARIRRLIDFAQARGGTFSLAHHRFATKEQIQACYPSFADFLQRQRAHDPEGRFQSEWSRQMVKLFGP